MRHRFAPVLIAGFLAIPMFAQQAAPAPAASSNDAAMEQKFRELEDRVIALEGQIRMLKAAAAQPTPAAQPGAAPAGAAQANAQPEVPPAATATQAQPETQAATLATKLPGRAVNVM